MEGSKSSWYLLVLLVVASQLHHMAQGAEVEGQACTRDNVIVTQTPRDDGSFIVVVNNHCFWPNCHPKNVVLLCSDYNPTWLKPAHPDFYRVEGTDICVVNDEQPIDTLASFFYSQDKQATFTVLQGDYECS